MTTAAGSLPRKPPPFSASATRAPSTWRAPQRPGPHPHRVGPEPAGRLLGAEHDGGRAVADGGAHEQRQRPRDLPAGEDLLDGDVAAVLGLGVELAVALVLHGDAGEVLRGGAALLHVVAGHAGVDVHERRLPAPPLLFRPDLRPPPPRRPRVAPGRAA